jgi:hypothetical protein
MGIVGLTFTSGEILVLVTMFESVVATVCGVMAVGGPARLGPKGDAVVNA